MAAVCRPLRQSGKKKQKKESTALALSAISGWNRSTIAAVLTDKTVDHARDKRQDHWRRRALSVYNGDSGKSNEKK